MKRFIFILLLLSAVLIPSCNDGVPRQPVIVDDEAVISGICDTLWTYFSFEENEVVGRSRLGSVEDDEFWASRDDWDFAVCGDRIRTNGGMSGIGSGGILVDRTTNYLLLDTAPVEGYVRDTVAIF